MILAILLSVAKFHQQHFNYSKAAISPCARPIIVSQYKHMHTLSTFGNRTTCASVLLIDITELQLTCVCVCVCVCVLCVCVCVCVCHLQMGATLLLSNWCHSNTAVMPIATHTNPTYQFQGVWGVCVCEMCGVCVDVRCVGCVWVWDVWDVGSKKQRLITHNVSMLSKMAHTTCCYYHKRKLYLLQAK